MNRRKPPLDYSRPDDREREPPQWWVLALILGCGVAIVLMIFLLEYNWG